MTESRKSKRSFNFKDASLSQCTELAQSRGQVRGKLKKKKGLYAFNAAKDTIPVQSPIEQLRDMSNKDRSKMSQNINIRRVSELRVSPEQMKEGKLAQGTSDSIINNHPSEISFLPTSTIFAENQRVQSEIVQPHNIPDVYYTEDNMRRAQLSLSERLCLALIDNKLPQFKENLEQMNVSFQGKKAYEAISLFFTLEDTLEIQVLADSDSDKRESIQQIQRTDLQKWSSEALKYFKTNYKSEINFSKISYILYYVLADSVEQLIDELLKEGNTDEAYLVSIFRGRIESHKPPSVFLRRFKKEYNLIHSQNLFGLQYSFWLFDFAVIIKYYEDMTLDECIKFIVEKYGKQKDQKFSCQFLMLAKHWNRWSPFNDKLVGQSEFTKVIARLPNFFSADCLSLFFLLKKYKQSLQSSFLMLLKELMRKIHNVILPFKLVESCELSSELVEELAIIYTKQNKQFKNSSLQVNNLLARQSTIEKKRYFSVLINQYMSHSKMWKTFKKGESFKYLEQLIKDYEIINQSPVVNFGANLELMAEVITSFHIACSLDKEKMKKYYQFLEQMEKKIKEKGYKNNHEDLLAQNNATDHLQLVQGCKYFTELQNGIFNLNNPRKLKSIQYLTTYLRKKLTNDSNAFINQFINFIEEITVKMLSSRNGTIYLNKIDESLEEMDKKFLVQLLPKLTCLRLRDLSETERQFSYVKVLNIVNCRVEIKRKMMITLEMS